MQAEHSRKDSFTRNSYYNIILSKQQTFRSQEENDARKYRNRQETYVNHPQHAGLSELRCGRPSRERPGPPAGKAPPEPAPVPRPTSAARRQNVRPSPDWPDRPVGQGAGREARLVEVDRRGAAVFWRARPWVVSLEQQRPARGCLRSLGHDRGLLRRSGTRGCLAR